jgi:hypothetical protein
MGFKYIVLEIDRKSAGRQRLPLIFPDVLVHDEVAAVIRVLPLFDANQTRVVSAGLITLEAIYCGGGSETLRIEESDPDDRLLVNSFPYFHGIIL